MSEVQSLLADGDAADARAPAPPIVTSVSVAPKELGSFPCLSSATTQRIVDVLTAVWRTLQRLGGKPAKPLFLYCEDYELPGAAFIGFLVALFVLCGFGVVIPALHSSVMRSIANWVFGAQVVVGYACLYLFRNTDPGYLPVNEGPIDAETAALLAQPQYQQTALVLTRPFVPQYSAAELEAQQRAKQIDEANGVEDMSIYGVADPQPLQQEWCRICRVWRPPRAAHCYTCQQCVQRQDHHCVLLGNCVGVRNHRFFLAFIFLVGSGASTLALLTLSWLLQSLASNGWWSGETWLSLALLVPFSLASGVLLVFYFHCWLLAMDVTLREKYGRKRSKYVASALTRRDKASEMWRQIGTAAWQWKRGSVGIRQKQEARRQAADPYRAQKTDASQPFSSNAAVSIVIAPGDEQIGCVGPQPGISEADGKRQ